MATGEPTDLIFAAAMDRLLNLQASPEDASLRADITAWCKADPAHARTWRRAQETWNAVGEVPPAHIAEWPVRKPAVARTGRWPRRRLTLATGRAIAACLLLLFVPGVLPGLHADHATRTAEVRDVVLADGSRLALGPRTGLDFRLRSDRRQASLLDGEAFFEVAADPNRPFVVDAAGVEVEVAAWRDGRLFVDGVTVVDLVEELGRYSEVWIIVADPRLAAQRVTGLFDVTDIDRALAALVQPFDGQVRSVTPLLRVLTMP